MKRACGIVAASALALGVLAAPPARADDRACVDAFERGQSHRNAGALRASRHDYAACAVDACAVAVRRECTRALEELARDTPTLVFGAHDSRGVDVADVRVLVDGEPVAEAATGFGVDVDPGAHVVRFERARYVPAELRVRVRSGERNRSVIVELATIALPSASARAGSHAEPAAPAKAASSPSPVVGYVLAGVGAAGVASFAVFGMLGQQEKSRLRAQCSPSCSEQEVETLRMRYLVADVSLGIGFVAAAVGTILIWSNSTKTVQASMAVSPQGPGTFTVTGAF